MSEKRAKLSAVFITNNSEETLEQSLRSVSFADEIVICDNYSKDRTHAIAKKYNAKIYKHNFQGFGSQKNFALSKARGSWVLLLDSDEVLSAELQLEIEQIILENPSLDGFTISYQNYFLGHPLTCKAQRYAKVRLFRKGRGWVVDIPIHEEVRVEGKLGRFKNKILHYSFRSIPQTLSKFTYYARIEAPLLWKKGERATLKKLTMYPLHMFWSIFVEDEGYKDGLWGFGLAVCFAYYEFARYFYLLLKQIDHQK